MSESWSSGGDSVNAYLALPLWMAGALAAFFLVVCVIALSREGPTRATRILVAGILLVASGLVSLALVQVQGAASSAQRAQLAARIAGLNASAIAQTSPLACLTGPTGEAVEVSCEKALFASPESASAALSFVEMQIALLARAVAADGADMPEVVGLRRAVETDRYGLAAQVFAARHGCASEHCSALLVLKDGARVRANLKLQKYDIVVRRYATAWPAGQAPVIAQTMGALPAFLNGIVDPATVASTNGSAGIDYPSAASIPPISIMNSEPVKEAAADAPAAARKAAPPAAQPKRPVPALAAAPPPPAPPAPPQAVVPAPATFSAQAVAAPPQTLAPPMNLQQQ